jgi:tetrahydromethanopterin S-methyltransferase subunit F
MDDANTDSPKWPSHGWLGLALIAVFWSLNWGLDGIRTHWGFFPMWLGYCLTVDALTFVRTGSSLLTRSHRAYAGLFVASVPAWWLFELINKRTQNWIYLDDGSIGPIEHALLASLAFSTVIPAVFGTAELVSSFRWVRRLPRGRRIAPTAGVLIGFFVAGLVMLALTLAWPRFFFPCVWLSVFFILEPLNYRLHYRTLLTHTSAGDWRAIVSLSTGVLICGLFWEFWNFWSFPKWIYDVPFVGFGHIFEMPVLGYGGYLPFALELFALYHLFAGILGYGAGWKYLRLGDD